ncbi:AMP-binding protein [Wenjunlia vitaminophila]|uniref:AMP-binding protein n=1 Tax=Wenjunlia vitaminophila TaxID=76728 RepID=A0A0T6LZA5_WENVI|nr:AMP-binding protein [Wenjunlia vitaminophila]KRV51318.1 AMP-binding protein [Wenjunlia vitaminophila]
MRTLSADPAYAFGGCDVALTTETVGQRLRRTVEALPSREALVECATGRRWTYAEFDRAVTEVARGLLATGIARGDRIGVWAPNCAEWTLTQHAAARVGAVLVNVDPLHGVAELRQVLNRTGVRLLVTHLPLDGRDHPAAVERVRADCPGLRDVVCVGAPSWQRFLAAGTGVAARDLADREAALSCHDPVAIQHTSGTTGFPKAAVLSHHSVLNSAHVVGTLLGYTDRDRICLPVPLHHCLGMVLGSLAATSHGACLVLPGPRFDADTTLRAVARERATSLYGVPSMFVAELDALDTAAHDLSSLRTCVVGGAVCPDEVVDRVVTEMRVPQVSVCYGTTETSLVSVGLPGRTRRGTGSVGKVLPHLEVKVVDPATGVTASRGEVGELCVRGHSVMLGYWGEPERTAEVVDEAGWLHTGDLAVLGGDGLLTVVGRMGDVIVRGGRRVYPREVEELLFGHPKIADVKVVGVPDRKYGQEVLACVVLRDDRGTLTAEELGAFCEQRGAGEAVPRYVRIVDAFPMTSSGKVRTVDLRAWASRELGLLG